MCFRADGKKPESRDKLQSQEMTGVMHDLAGVFLMRTVTSCSVTGSNTVSGGADLNEMVSGGTYI